MDPLNLGRLQEVQEQILAETQKTLDQLKSYRDDYKALKKRLLTLPNKVSHNITVPFGNLAFMPGQLVHTNEILVLLGDDWFVERSAKQACEIIDRRIEHLNEKISKVEQERSLVEPRLSYTSELQNIAKHSEEVFEIQEPYDEAEDREWRECHKQSLREQLKQGRERRDKGSESERKLFERLDELAKLEEKNRELERISDEEEIDKQEERTPLYSSTASPSNNLSAALDTTILPATCPSEQLRGSKSLPTEKRRSVTWEDESAVLCDKSVESTVKEKSENIKNGCAVTVEEIDYDDNDDDYSDSDLTDEYDSELTDDSENDDNKIEENRYLISSPAVNVIHFKHAPSQELKSPVPSGDVINSPADIYLRFRSPPRSILKKKTTTAVSTKKQVKSVQYSNDSIEKSVTTPKSNHEVSKKSLIGDAIKLNVVERVQPTPSSESINTTLTPLSSADNSIRDVSSNSSCSQVSEATSIAAILAPSSTSTKSEEVVATAAPPRISKFKVARMKANYS